MPTSPMRWLYHPVLISQQRKWPCSLTTAACALVDGTTAAITMVLITPVLCILTDVITLGSRVGSRGYAGELHG